MHARQVSILHFAIAAALVLTGCSHELAIPGSAKLVDSGQGRLSYVAEENGNIFLLDSTAKKPVFGTHIGRDEKITVDPDLDVIDIAGKSAEHKPPINPEHVYRLFFDRDS